MELDQYLRAGLNEEVDAVIHAAQRWRTSIGGPAGERLKEAIDALADAYVAFNEAVEEFKKSNGEAGELVGGKIVP